MKKAKKRYTIGDILVVHTGHRNVRAHQMYIGRIRAIRDQNNLSITWAGNDRRYISENYSPEMESYSGNTVCIYIKSQWEELLELCIE